MELCALRSRVYRPCPHVSVFVWKRNFFYPFLKRSASTREQENGVFEKLHFGDRLRVDGRPIRKKKVAFSKISRYVWTWPKLIIPETNNCLHFFFILFSNFLHQQATVHSLAPFYFFLNFRKTKLILGRKIKKCFKRLNAMQYICDYI